VSLVVVMVVAVVVVRVVAATGGLGLSLTVEWVEEGAAQCVNG